VRNLLVTNTPFHCIFTASTVKKHIIFFTQADENTRECSVLSFPLEKIIWSQEQNIKTSIKHGQSNWISVITLSWFIEAQFKLRVQWNATSFGTDVGNSFVSSFQLEFQPAFLLLSVSFFFLLVFFWGIVGSRGPPKRLLLGVKHDTLKTWSWCWSVKQNLCE